MTQLQRAARNFVSLSTRIKEALYLLREMTEEEATDEQLAELVALIALKEEEAKDIASAMDSGKLSDNLAAGFEALSVLGVGTASIVMHYANGDTEWDVVKQVANKGIELMYSPPDGPLLEIEAIARAILLREPDKGGGNSQGEITIDSYTELIDGVNDVIKDMEHLFYGMSRTKKEEVDIALARLSDYSSLADTIGRFAMKHNIPDLYDVAHLYHSSISDVEMSLRYWQQAALDENAVYNDMRLARSILEQSSEQVARAGLFFKGGAQ